MSLFLRLAPVSDPAGIRTQDPYIKSVLLYQLSYGIIVFKSAFPVLESGAKIGLSTLSSKINFR